jgi:hypothetical protein
MAWQPGQSGNPEGKRKEAIIRSQLLKACAQDDYARIRKLCETALDLAASGEQWACNFVADRLDGKPAQAVEHSGEGGGPLVITWLTAQASE